MSVGSTELVKERRRRLDRRRERVRSDERPAALISPAEWERPSVRYGVGAAHIVLLVLLVVGGLGPLLWLAKSAITPTNDTITHPMGLFQHGFAFGNLSDAWTNVDVARYFWNTIVIAIGSWASQLFVATTAGYALSVLRPAYAKVITALLLTTLFVPGVVLLVPLYIEIVHVPIVHHTLIDTYWAIWLPAGASAFNVVIMKRFFDNLPREIFEAARIDGAGPFTLFWKIVLPMSTPILGVVSIFAVLASWKDFLWPLLVLTDPSKQPLSVRLPSIEGQTELGVFLAAMFIACLVPVAGFLVFQRSFLRGSGLSGAIKG